MRPTFLTVTTAVLLALAAVLPSSSAAQRRPVPERSGTPARPTVTPRGNQERRTLAPRPSFPRPSTTCRVIVQSGLEVGTIELLKVRSDDGMTWAEVGAVTGYRMLGPENGYIHGARRPRVGIVSIEALGVDRVTLSVTAPTLLQGGGASVPFTGGWAVSDQPMRGYVPMAGSEREVVLPPSGRIYVRLGGRVAFKPEELPAAKQWQGEEYAGEWIVHVSSGAGAVARPRADDCLHVVAVPVSVVLRQPASVCTVTASPDALDFGAVRRTREPPPTGYRHEHSITVDETKTPAEVTLTDASGDHFDGAPSGQRGWMSVRAGATGAFVLPSFPGTIDHAMPPDDLNEGEVTAIPYAATWAHHEGTSATGDDFTSLATCDPTPCSPSSHQIPSDTEHEIAFGGTIAYDYESGNVVDFVAVPGAYSGTIEVTVSCN